jgi:DNA integrity scanning protein DisA with diadenylate cyclase activity
MTTQEWAREAMILLEQSIDPINAYMDVCDLEPNGKAAVLVEKIMSHISTYPEGESGKESDTVQKKLELYGSMVINVRSLRTFLTQYHPSYTRWIEEIDFILARAALLEEAVRLLKISYRHLPQLYGETEDELLQGQIQNFLARAKEALNNAKI